jgi:hypothetical protein
MGALVFDALKLHWQSADASPRSRAAFSDREIYAEVFR